MASNQQTTNPGGKVTGIEVVEDRINPSTYHSDGMQQQGAKYGESGGGNALRPEQPLSGQQMAALQKQYAQRLGDIHGDIELRKYALEKAVLCLSDKPISPDQFIELAGKIHDFVTLPAAEVKVTIS